MADVYKVLQPAKYLKEFLSRNIRADGRGFEECRAAVIQYNPISTADGSCMVILGDTKICCGIKAELTTPSAENPSAGFIVTNLEMPAICSPIFRSGPPGDLAQSCNQLLADIFKDSQCIDMQELCITKEKLVWVLYCDIICLNYGGSLLDAALLSLISALKSVQLPVVEYSAATENCVVLEDKRKPLNILKFPVATTFTLFDSKTMLLNPTVEEEQQCGGILGGTTIVWRLNYSLDDKEEELVQGVHQLGNSPIPQAALQRALLLTQNRSKQIRELAHSIMKS